MVNVLRREYILRGFGTFENVLVEGKKFYTNNLFVSVLTEKIKTGLDIKVGFLVSKKKLKKQPDAIV